LITQLSERIMHHVRDTYACVHRALGATNLHVDLKLYAAQALLMLGRGLFDQGLGHFLLECIKAGRVLPGHGHQRIKVW
jgi:hypothetical protein